ncbi:MAG: hypothetical protein ACREMH_10940 [Gemmatimonadales bacterium]
MAIVSLPPVVSDSDSGDSLELPTSHRVPLSWLVEHGGEAIRYRSLRDLAPLGSVPAAELSAARAAVLDSKAVAALARKQRDDGVWGGNLMGFEADKVRNLKDTGTIPQYRLLIQHGLGPDDRVIRSADRLLFRLLSRDDDPALMFEWQELGSTEPIAEAWVRWLIREAASAALAEAGHLEDPRLRGAGHKVASAVSQFLRSPLAESPLAKAGRQTVLHPEAYPPTWYSAAMLAAMPSLQRERAGFVTRLGEYLSRPAPRQAYVVHIGKASVTPDHLLLGNPVETDSRGAPKDIPLALHFLELMARLGTLPHSEPASLALGRLLEECDERGVWHPKNLRAAPRVENVASYHTWPLADGRNPEARMADATFRLALIAKLLGWQLEYV